MNLVNDDHMENDDFLKKLDSAINEKESYVPKIATENGSSGKPEDIVSSLESNGATLSEGILDSDPDALSQVSDKQELDISLNFQTALNTAEKEAQDLLEAIIDRPDETVADDAEDNLTTGQSKEPEEKVNDDILEDDFFDDDINKLLEEEVETKLLNGEEDGAKTEVEEPIENVEASSTEAKADDLLVACESPEVQPKEENLDNVSESSSSVGEEGSEADKPGPAGDSKVEPDLEIEDVEPMDVSDTEANEPLAKKEESKEESTIIEVVEKATVGSESKPIEDAESENVEDADTQIYAVEIPDDSLEEISVEEESAAPPTKEFVPFKFNFMKKFSSTVGKLSRSELEELLIQKITESIMFCTEVTEIRTMLEKQTVISDNFKKRLEDVKKQYNDLEMIHNRVMKDLKERPDAPITPVKITRAVGLQVYQPPARTTKTIPAVSVAFTPKPSNKRPMEMEPPVNGVNVSPDGSVKRKKMLKITPMRPPLSDKAQESLAMQEAKQDQLLRSTVTIPPSVTMTPVHSSSNGLIPHSKPGPASSKNTSSNSIDLTDDDDASISSSGKGTPFQQPPALVAIRAGSTANRAFVKQPVMVPNQRVMYRR